MAEPDPSELLLRAREKVVNTLDRLPRYMCTQTVDRSEYELAQPDVDVKDCDDPRSPRDARRKLDRVMADRLRLDVGMAAQGEIYSWVGENQFRNRSLFSIVNQGIASTGHFDGFLDLIFRSDHADFSYSGQISDGGRNLVEYSYRVPLEASHYDVVFHGQTVTTAYEGTLRIDPQTAELVRMTLRTSRPPSETGACEITHTMNFGRFRLNGSDFLLPSEAHLHIKELNGGETENSTGYSGCREFLGESTLKFEPPPDVPAQQAAAPRAEPPIPAGLPFRLALAENIRVATAAAGETVTAVLTTDLRDEAKTVLVAKGTPVLCRILRIRRWSGHAAGARPKRVELLLGLENFALPGGHRPVYAQPDRGRSASPPQAGTLQSRPTELGPLNAMGGNQWFANFPRAGDDYVIKSGLESNWVTVAP